MEKKGGVEKEGARRRRKGESKSKLDPSPRTVCHKSIFGNVSRCPGLVLHERPRRDVSDKYSWHRHPVQIPSEHQPQEVFFAKSKLSLQKRLLMLHLWAREYPVSDAAEEAEILLRVAVDIYQWLQDVCTNKLLQALIILVGPGVIVQIDESLYRHKPKVCR